MSESSRPLRVVTGPSPAASASLDPHARRARALRRLVGNTPMLAIELTLRGEPRTIYAKAENLNLTGSIKDRMALHILTRAHETGAIRPGDRIVEATSGNTGISFAAVGRALGHPVTIFMPDWMSRERVDLIRSLGATIVPVAREQGGFLGSISLAEELARREGSCFLPCQFSNDMNPEAHSTSTGPEIWAQLRNDRARLAAFVAGVGTGGTVMGVGRFLKARDPSIRIHPIQPAESPTLSAGRRVGRHRIQGISDEFIPPIVDLGFLDEVVSVPDGDAILMAQKLARDLGLAVGISSGANFIGALLVQDRGPLDGVAATVFPDDNKKYLTTDLLRQEPVRPDYLTPAVELLGIRTMGRLCDFCFDDPPKPAPGPGASA